MLWETLQYYSTPAPTYVRKMGFLHEAIAMAARHKRCFPQWQTHFDRCQKAILQAADQCSSHRTIVILGAGSLRDIPLEQLSQQFEKVQLVDVVFLRAAKRLVKPYANIELIEADVTESLDSMRLGSKQIKQPTLLQDEVVDCVVSLNLATQIPLIPVRWLMHGYGLSEKEADALGKGLIQAHLDYLNGFDAVHCLIADRQITEFNQHGEQTDQFDPAWDVPLPDITVEWDWEVIPLGESADDANLRQINKVGVSIW